MGTNYASKLSEFIKSEQSSGVLLICCVTFSLIIANSSIGLPFQRLLSSEIGFHSDLIHLKFSLLNWINDGLMAIFFFFIGLEIKQELIDGHLSSFKKASVPVLAALGGALIPALIFMFLNHGTVTHIGWGIPMATDIAFALGILSLLGKIIPAALKVFLSTLAVVDDLLAILIIAIFYTTALNWNYLLAAIGIFLFLIALNKLGIIHLTFYVIPGLVMWYFIHHSGIHATIAGVLTALAIPSGSTNSSPLKKAAHSLATPVTFIIMPLFAIANTNIQFESAMITDILSMLGLGIIIGLVFGKPIGIILFSWLAVKLKIGALPEKISWKHILGIGLLAGIGFTMSIFISFISFGGSIYNLEAKFSILISSILAGIFGFVYLKKVLKDTVS